MHKYRQYLDEYKNYGSIINDECNCFVLDWFRIRRKAVGSTELSGRNWVNRFPTSRSIADLKSPFKENVNSFISALRAAGATVTISATYRPVERAYLMYYAYQIAKMGLDPKKVPPHKDVNINWVHTDANGHYSKTKSINAALEMCKAYNISYKPAINTNHTAGFAIDMTITWKGTLKIVNAKGTTKTISSTPRTGAGNTDLHAIGKSYNVLKLVSDPPHWSVNGH